MQNATAHFPRLFCFPPELKGNMFEWPNSELSPFCLVFGAPAGLENRRNTKGLRIEGMEEKSLLSFSLLPFQFCIEPWLAGSSDTGFPPTKTMRLKVLLQYIFTYQFFQKLL